VIEFTPVPVHERGSRRAVVRWNDGTTGEALRWYDDEILVCEGDLLGKTADELCSLVHRRDLQHLHRDP
jgi:hypothetical protein